MLFRKISLSLVLIIFLTTNLNSFAWAQPTVVGKAAVLIDSKSGQVLYAKNENTVLPPASTTKMLTGIIAIERSNPTDVVISGKNPTLVEPSAIGLKENEKIMMENLLYSLLLKSANDGAVAIAEHISGSVPEFAQLMNEQAKKFGATNSNFVNPNGLPDPNHVSTALDLGMIAKHAMENPEFRKIVGTKVKVIPRENDADIKYLQNHNKLLWRYEGAIGIKTGYTREAKQCLVASAACDEQELIAVVLGSEGTNIWSDVSKLLDYGFAGFSTNKYKDANVVVKTIAVDKGVSAVALLTEKEFYYTWPKSKAPGEISEEVELNTGITAPVVKGQILGKLKFSESGKEIGFVNLIAREDIPVKRFALPDSAVSVNPVLAGVLVLGVFVLWNLQKRKRRMRRKSRGWHNRNGIR